MEHSPKYDIVLTYYKRKLWVITPIKNWTTPDEFQEITGISYEEE